MGNQGEFLRDKYWGSEDFRKATEQAARRTKVREGKGIPNEPGALIENYLKRFTDIFKREDDKDRERGIEAVRRFLHSKYVIKPENISDEYIKGVLFGNFAELKGYNRGDLKDPDIKQALLKQFRAQTGQSFEDYRVPEDEREKVREVVIKDQKSRLDSWLFYLISPGAENIPAAYRYWVFAEMLKLGSYDDERKVYNERTKDTAAPFPELDQQALALVLDEILRKQKGEPSAIVLADEKQQAEFSRRLKSENFGKLYAFAQEYLKSLRLPTERLIITDGEWRVFPKGSDPKEVVKALAGYHAGWCIAGEGAAASYLTHSDLHIYFSKDANGNNTIPRACVVVSKESGVTEVRGIMSDQIAKQHLDDYITPVVEKRLASLPGGKEWSAQMKDMKLLAAIHLKHLRREELSKDDLRFLYEIDREIKGTGWGRDPRIDEILKGRDIKSDLSFILGIPKDRISTTRQEALSGNIAYHWRDLDLSDLTWAKNLKLPESIGGNLFFGRLTSAKGLKLPESIDGDLFLDSLTSAKGLKLPKSIGGDLYLRSLISAEGLKLPESVGRNLYLKNLTSAKNLKLPESIGGDLFLDSLTSAKGLKLPKSIGGDLILWSLKSAKGLEFPESVGGDLDLRSLTSAKGLKLPKSIGRNLYLRSLTSAKGLELPKSVGGDLDLRSLTSAKGLKLPKSIGGNLRLDGLTLAEGLEFPESINGDLILWSLRSAESLKLPKSVDGDLDLRSLTSAKGLEFPESIRGTVCLFSLSSAEKNNLRAQYPNLLII